MQENRWKNLENNTCGKSKLLCRLQGYHTLEGENLEPEVHIIEKYFQLIRHCFTMTNIRCKRGKEIDLLAVNPKSGEKYHVESRVSTSKGFALREKDTQTSKGRPLRRGLDYFLREKFNHPLITEKISELFGDFDYQKVLVVWRTKDDYSQINQIAVEKYGINIWVLRGMVIELMRHKVTSGSRDDVLRIMELASLVKEEDRAIYKELDEIYNLIKRRKGKSPQARKLLKSLKLRL